MNKLSTLMRSVEKHLGRLTHKGDPHKPRYVIAGGAVRDTLLGQPVSDIDVVVERMEDWDVDWTEFNPNYTMYTQGCTGLCNTGEYVDGKEIQLIHRNGDISITSMHEYHSMGVSNVFWDNGHLIIHESNLNDVADKMHTLNLDRLRTTDMDLFHQYVRKVLVKYPWPLRVPAYNIGDAFKMTLVPYELPDL